MLIVVTFETINHHQSPVYMTLLLYYQDLSICWAPFPKICPYVTTIGA